VQAGELLFSGAPMTPTMCCCASLVAGLHASTWVAVGQACGLKMQVVFLESSHWSAAALIKHGKTTAAMLLRSNSAPLTALQATTNAECSSVVDDIGGRLCRVDSQCQEKCMFCRVRAPGGAEQHAEGRACGRERGAASAC